MPIDRAQLRMTPDELEEFLRTERTARVATVSPDGEPHVAPMWFVWHDGAMYVTSLKRSRRQRDVERGSRVAACVDAGEDYGDLRGVVLYGSFADIDPPPAVRRAFGKKYWGDVEVPDRRSHTWLALRPDRVVSWDFSKIPAGRDDRAERSR